ncbi:MAG: hypothetical protein ACI8SR_001657 [Oceanicoccus sp.]|jgi:hypothetical protein
MKIGIVIIITLSVLLWVLFSANNVSIVDPAHKTPTAELTTPPSLTNQGIASPKQATTTPPDITQTPTQQANNTVQAEPTNPAEKSHLDHLSPEMKQSIKDKLFHHGPKTVTKDSKGRLCLDQTGRYVNMPVAVRKADGTIEIKEYSVIPDSNTVTAP